MYKLLYIGLYISLIEKHHSINEEATRTVACGQTARGFLTRHISGRASEARSMKRWRVVTLSFLHVLCLTITQPVMLFR